MKSDSQSVSQRRQVDYAQRHPGQPNDGELLSALLENTEDSIYFKDLESRFLKISHALAKKLRLHHSDDAVGKSDSDFFAQTHAQKALEDELRIMRTGSALLSAEERETWPDGTETWVLTNKMALLDAKGKVIGSFGFPTTSLPRRRRKTHFGWPKKSTGEFSKMRSSESFKLGRTVVR